MKKALLLVVVAMAMASIGVSYAQLPTMLEGQSLHLTPGKATFPQAALTLPDDSNMLSVAPRRVASATIPYYQDFNTVAAGSALPEGWVNPGGNFYLMNYNGGKAAAVVTYPSNVPGELHTVAEWLISPMFNLVAGVKYTISYHLSTGSQPQISYTLKLAVGSGQNNNDMNNGKAIEYLTSIPGQLKQTYTNEFVATTTGPACIGFYVVGNGSYILRIDDFSIESQGSIPQPVADLTVTPDAMGDARAEISFTAPDKTVDGSDITAILSCEVMRDNVVVKTFSNPTPGSQLTFTDECEGGSHTWKVKTTTADGSSESEAVTAFIGVNKPGAPTAFDATDNADGSIMFAWDAPTTDIDGGALNPAVIKGYRIYDENSETPSLLTQATASPTLLAGAFDPEGTQRICQYSVAGYTSGGEGAKAYTLPMMIGKPMSLPFRESFSNQSNDNDCMVLNLGSYATTITIYRDGEVMGQRSSFEHDDGFLNIKCNTLGGIGGWFSPLVSLDAENPVLNFHYYTQPEWKNRIYVAVRCEGSEYKFLGEPFVTDAVEGWHLASVDLSQYAGKNVQVALIGEIVSHTIVMVDNIRIYDTAENNLAVTRVIASRSVTPGDNVPVNVTYCNNGTQPVSNFMVLAYRNGVKIGEMKHEGTLAPGEEAVAEFTDLLPVAVPSERVTYSGEVYAEQDTRENDNTAQYVADANLPVLPVPTSLQGERVKGQDGIMLAWNAPDLTATNRLVRIENFESYPTYAKSNIGDWTLYDGDNRNTPEGFNPMKFPGIDGQKVSWFVIDSQDNLIINGDPNMNDRYWTRVNDGRKYLSTIACSSNYNVANNNDWLISPELSGEEQVISFWARNYINVGGQYELLEVLYSTTNNSPSSFKSLGEGGPNNWIWTKFQIHLPAGAKYFAIRYIADNMYSCFIDDIEFIPATPKGLNLLGYDVYRDGVKINSQPVTEAYYNDTDVNAEVDHTYCVAAVYDKGSSRSSEYAVVRGTTVGIEQVNNSGSSVNIWSAPGRVCVSTTDTACGIEIYSVAGVMINRVSINGYAEIAVAPGIYIVKAGNTVTKVIVR